MKKFVSGFVISALIFTMVPAFANEGLNVVLNQFPIFVDGSETNVDAYNINGSTFIKLTDVSKALAGKVDVNFNKNNRTIQITSITNQIPDRPQARNTSAEYIVTEYKGFPAREYDDGVIFVQYRLPNEFTESIFESKGYRILDRKERIENPNHSKSNYYDESKQTLVSNKNIPKYINELIYFEFIELRPSYDDPITTSKIDTSNSDIYKDGYIHSKYIDELLDIIEKL